MNKQRIISRFRKSITSYDQHAVVQEQVAKILVDQIVTIGGVDFDNVLEVGCGSGLLTEKLVEKLNVGSLVCNDIVPEAEAQVRSRINGTNFSYVVGDAEQENLGSGFDLIVSSSTLQWFSDPIGGLNRLSQLLKPGGLLAIATYGQNNFREVRSVSSSGLYYPDFSDVKIQSELTRLLYLKDTITLVFDEPYQVLKHIKLTGVNGTGSVQWTKKHLNEFTTQYKSLFTTESGVTLTYEPVYLIYRKEK